MFKIKKQLGLYTAIWQALSFVLMGVWIRMMEGSFSVNQQIFWRLFLASLMAWIVFGKLFNKNIFSQIKNKDWLIYITRSLLNYSVGVYLFTIAILNTNLAVVSFISSLPIMGLIGWILFREKLDRRALPFVLISVIGLYLVSGINGSDFVISIGILAAILSTLGFDISYLMVRYHPKKLNNFHNTTLILSFSWVVPLILILSSGEQILPKNLSQVALFGLLASVIFNIIGLYTLNYVFKNLKAYVAGNILLLEGVFAIIIGFLFYNERLNIEEIIGALLIVFCAYMISRLSLRQQKVNGTKI